MSASLKSGTLYVVATPIGNRNDISLRALMTLQDVQLVLAEDTRTAHKLFSLYPDRKFHVHVTRLDQHVQGTRLLNIVDQIAAGVDAALISEAGTPQISDPGESLIALAQQRGLAIVPIPGPSALATIISVADFHVQPVAFFGFLPKKKGRQTTLDNLSRLGGKYAMRSAVLYESPERIRRTLEDLGGILGTDTHVVIGRELTKLHEELFYGTLVGALEHFTKPRGEFTVLIQLSQ